MSNFVEHLRWKGHQQGDSQLLEAADLLEWYELQNDALLKGQERLQAVVDAARELQKKHDLRCGTKWFRALDDALRALDGEVNP